jgi:phospholipase/lecithinase/hemolysin
MHTHPLKYLLQTGFITLLLSLTVTGWSGSRDEHRHLVVFGDSLSDPGNFYALTGLTSTAPYDLIPSAPYAIGDNHFTNGETWVEQLADALDTQAGPAYAKARFSNYAVGGARARVAGFMDLSTQVSSYLGQKHRRDRDDTLYIVMIGGNDVRDAIEALLLDPTGATSMQILTAAVTSVNDNLQALYAAGARQIVVANAPDLAVVPAVIYAGPQVQAAAHFISVTYNMALDNLLNQLEPALQLQFTRLDIYAQLYAMINKPQAYGLRNVDTPCLTPGVIDHAVCAKPDSYLFWDGIHPTRKGHAVIAAYAKRLLQPAKSRHAQSH